MTNATVTTWKSVQRHQGAIAITTRTGPVPAPGCGEARVRILGAGICGADIRVVGGNKHATGDPTAYITLGHEGTGIVEALGPGATSLHRGDQVVVLPHHFPANHATYCTSHAMEPECIGNGHSLHDGWDLPGIMGDIHIGPCTHLVRVDAAYLRQAETQAPHIGPAFFAFTEPMLCVLSSYALLDAQLAALTLPQLTAGRGLVIGCGPIGVLHAVALRKRGYTVWLADTADARIRRAQWCLEGGEAYSGQGDFDLVMVTASSAAAITMGERLVRDGGVLYLFAGLNTAERDQTDATGTLRYERVHRAARALVTTLAGKRIVYAGHSGYYDRLAPHAVAMVAANATALGRAITGVIPGWDANTIVGQQADIPDWQTSDGSPALLAVLRGQDLRDTQCKIIVTVPAA